MRILFFITANGNGRGGHYHSLNHISRELGKHHEVKIISIGVGNSGVLETNPFYEKHIFFNGLNLFELSRDIKKLREQYRPEIYHCFDVISYNMVRIFISSRKNKIILNKCGGPNPYSYQFPHVHNIVLFSLENKRWFNNNVKFKNSSIYLIPNRSETLIIDRTYEPVKKDLDSFIFVRICRITNVYKKSIYDSINLIKKLKEKYSYKVKLYIIGSKQDTNLYDSLIKNKTVLNGDVIVITDPRYTFEASKLLYLSDAVIGTGRGLIEAMSLSRPVLTIDEKGDIPVLIDDSNFHDAFLTNFSERNNFSKNKADHNINNIVKLIEDKCYYDEISDFSKTMFDEYFDLKKAVSEYQKVYEKSKTGKRSLLSDSYIIVYYLILFYRTSKKKKNTSRD